MLAVMTTIVGEALNRRADLQKRIAQLQDRISASVLAQEGEDPPERPDELLAELDGLCDELQPAAPTSLQPSSPRMSSAVRLLANRSPLSITPLNSAALRRASARTLSSIVSRATIR